MTSSGIKQMFRSTLYVLTMVILVFSISCAARDVRDTGDWTGVEVTGKLTDMDGGPVSGGYLYAYEYGSSILGPAQAMSEPSESSGKYIMVVPPGEYNLVARRRLSGSISGPLRNGDLAGRVEGVFIAGSGVVSNVDIVLRVFRQGSEGDPTKILNTRTRVSGVLIDTTGRPVAGAHAFAYRGKSRRDPPDYLSESTESDGRFSISLPDGGKYAIGARTGLRGRPRDDDLIGFWGGPDETKFIGDGEVVENIELKLVPFGERSKK